MSNEKGIVDIMDATCPHKMIPVSKEYIHDIETAFDECLKKYPPTSIWEPNPEGVNAFNQAYCAALQKEGFVRGNLLLQKRLIQAGYSLENPYQ